MFGAQQWTRRTSSLDTLAASAPTMISVSVGVTTAVATAIALAPPPHGSMQQKMSRGTPSGSSPTAAPGAPSASTCAALNALELLFVITPHASRLYISALRDAISVFTSSCARGRGARARAWVGVRARVVFS